MAGGRKSLELRELLAGMSNAEIEAALRTSPSAAGEHRADRLPDAAWEELALHTRPRDGDWAGACLAVAEHRYALREYAGADRTAAQAGGVYRKIGRPLNGAACDLLQAAALAHVGQHAKAVEFLDRAKAAFAAHDRVGDVAICDHLRGKALSELGLLQDALEAQDRAAGLLAHCDGPADAARCHFERGRVLQALERWEEAVDAYGTAERRFAGAGLLAEAAACITGRGAGLQGLGRYLEAISAYEEARRLFLQQGMRAEAASCDCGRGVALQSLERYRDAIAAYEKATPILRAAERFADAAASEAGRAAALDSLGEYGRAVAVFLTAASYYTACKEPVAAARCDLERGNALQALEKYEEAITAYRQAKAAYAEQRLVVDEARCEANRGVALSRLGDHRRAITSFVAACPVLEQFEQWRALSWAQCGCALCHQALGDLDAALSSYLAACDSLEAAVDGVSGEHKEFSDFAEQFPDPFTPAILLRLERAGSATDDERSAARQEALVLAERQRSAAVRHDLTRGLRRGSLALDSLNPQLLAHWMTTKREQALLAGRMRQAGRHGSFELRRTRVDTAPRREELQRALTCIEDDLLATDPETAGLISRRLPPLAGILGALGTDEGLISYVESGDDTICLLADSRGMAEARVIPGGCRAAQGAAVASAREFVSLGELLLRPALDLGWLDDGPSSKRRLRIVPSPSLFTTPFAALGLPQPNGYLPLVSRTELVLAPQAVTGFYQQSKTSEGHGMVLLADPGDNRLCDMEAILRMAQPTLEIRLSPLEWGASAPPAADLLRGQRYLHTWCRSHHPGAPLGCVAIPNLYEVPHRLDLAFIEILGDPQGAQVGLPALVRGWLRVAKQVILSFRSGPDRAAIELIRDFYQSLGQGFEPATALARAQRQCFAAGLLNNDESLAWSRFVAMG